MASSFVGGGVARLCVGKLTSCGGRTLQQKSSKATSSSFRPWLRTPESQSKQRCNQIFYRQIQNDSKVSDASTPSSPTFRERLSELRQNGTPEIIIGTLILAVFGVDYALQLRNDEQKAEMYRQLQREVKRDGEISRQDMIESGSADATKTLFQCIVRRIPPLFDGHKCLTDVKIGDVVNVIEEGVGPGGQYNLCSIERAPSQSKGGDENDIGNAAKVSIGWFPCSCLEKVQ